MNESVPWLYANGKVAEAEKIIQKAAKTNDIKLPDVVLKVKHVGEEVPAKIDDKESTIAKLKKKFTSNRSHSHHYSTSYTLVDLFKSRLLVLHLGVSSFLWYTFIPESLS